MQFEGSLSPETLQRYTQGGTENLQEAQEHSVSVMDPCRSSHRHYSNHHPRNSNTTCMHARECVSHYSNEINWRESARGISVNTFPFLREWNSPSAIFSICRQPKSILETVGRQRGSTFARNWLPWRKNDCFVQSVYVIEDDVCIYHVCHSFNQTACMSTLKASKVKDSGSAPLPSTPGLMLVIDDERSLILRTDTGKKQGYCLVDSCEDCRRITASRYS